MGLGRGGSDNGGRGAGGGRDEKSIQADINRSLKESGGQWTSNLNDLVAEREAARSRGTTSGRTASGGIADLGRSIASIPGNIARDVRMGAAAGMFGGRERQAENLANRGFSPAEIQDYFARTDATIARTEAERMARSNEDRGDAQERARMAGQQDTRPEDQMPRYRSPFGQAPTAPGGKGSMTTAPQITPEMRQEALRIFESQRGAGQVPYQMMPFQQGLGSMRPNVSPAFQYAAQNYSRLGGAQRLMDRPMEMMSVAERQRINEMAQGMAGMQRPTPFPGKGAGTQPPQSEVLRRIMPVIGQMGIGSLRGSATPMPPQ